MADARVFRDASGLYASDEYGDEGMGVNDDVRRGEEVDDDDRSVRDAYEQSFDPRADAWGDRTEEDAPMDARGVPEGYRHGARRRM
jgi:hypothetical protein